MNPWDDLLSSSIEKGGIRVCPELVVSFNRSWKVDFEKNKIPEAAFKSQALVHKLPESKEEGSGDHYLAAVAPHDAFWLGFDSTEGSCFGIIISFDGCNLISKLETSEDEKLVDSPRNFLLLPDQPWFDYVAGPDGFFQLLPRYEGEANKAKPHLGESVTLKIFRIDEALIEPKLASEKPAPLHTQTEPQLPSIGSFHPWTSRNLKPGFKSPAPVAVLNFRLLDPPSFQAKTNVQFPKGMFTETVESKSHHNPFQ